MLLTWTAWNNGKHHGSGAGYGLRVPAADRDTYFNRQWSTVILELPKDGGFSEVAINVAKASFWNETCREVISQEIGQWLHEVLLAPWPSGHPPKIKVEVRGEWRFRVLR